MAAVGHPRQLTSQVIEALLEGRSVELGKAYEAPTVAVGEASPQEPQVWMELLPYEYGSTTSTAGTLFVAEWTMGEMLGFAYGLSRQWALSETRSLDSAKLFTEVLLPKAVAGHAGFAQALRDYLVEHPGIQVERAAHEMDVYVMSKGPVVSDALTEVHDAKGSGHQYNGVEGTFAGANCRMDQFARIVEGIVRRPVLNETGMDGRYDWNLTISEDQGFVDAIEEHLGLRIDSTQRTLDVLVLRSFDLTRSGH